MKKSLGEILTALRKEAGLTQPRVSELLAAEGIDIRTAGISKWEKGLTQPSATQFLALCGIYGVEDVMGVFTDRQSPTSGLNAEGRRLVSDYTRVLLASGLYEAEHNSGRVLPLYNLAASAGTGQFLDSDDYENIDVPAGVPARADFGVRIAGDSMEPAIRDGAIVWLHSRQTIENGRIGVFYYAGQAYCKKLERREDGVYLVSLNHRYEPILTSPEEQLLVFGEVVAVS